METYLGHIRTPTDAIILFEACRFGLLRRVQRRLSAKERESIRHGSVFVWDEREAGMRRWTDGRSWSASHVSGSFLTYREMVRSGESGGEGEEGSNGYFYKPNGLVKQSFSITTSTGQHLHLISYRSASDSATDILEQPSTDPALRLVRPQKGLYPSGLQVNDPQEGAASAYPCPPKTIGEQLYVPTDSGYASLSRGDKSVGPPVDPLPKPFPAQDAPLLRVWSEDLSNPDVDERGSLDDQETIYSDEGSLAGWETQGYVAELASDLCNRVRLEDIDKESGDRLLESLPRLLRTFSLRVGANADGPMHRNVMYFVHKYRNQITESFLRQSLQGDEVEEVKKPAVDDGDKMSTREFIIKWLQKVDDSAGDEENLQLPSDRLEDGEEEPMQLPALEAYRDFIARTPAFDWLVAMMRRELTLSPQAPNHQEMIRNSILSELSSPKAISRRSPPTIHAVILRVMWDPQDFIHAQEYCGNMGDALASAITLTGSLEDAQALQCIEYLKQTWPGSAGQVMQLVKDIVSDGTGRAKVQLVDGTDINMCIHRGGGIMVRISGVAESIAEIVEQLAWLGAALRTNITDAGVQCCYPVVKTASPNWHGSSNYFGMLPADTGWVIYFADSDLDPSSRFEGQCWHGLFKNPVVVLGFPIPRRSQPGTGLELPLNMLAELVQTKRIQYFGENTVIKGFSTILYAVKQVSGLVIWHLLFNGDGSRISYDAIGPTSCSPVGTDEINGYRHVVGWCSHVQYCAGAMDASYEIEKSGLPKPHKGCALENAFIRTGRTISGGSPVTLGKKDIPPYVSRTGYLLMLKWLSKKFVLFWDEEEKRGWLVNGTSALLHLVRQSLKHDSNDAFKSEFLFRWDQMQESSSPYTTNSAIDVLLDSSNKDLKLYREKDGFIKLEDKVEHLCESLEKAIDYQIRGRRRGDRGTGQDPWKYLEGWDFHDLATDKDPSFARVTTLHPTARGWAGLIRSIHVLPLFGHGFGDILIPQGISTCKYWSQLPMGRYLIAGSISDIQHIMDLEGDRRANPAKLSEDVLWYHVNGTFDPCECTWNGENKHSDPVQVLVPACLGRRLPERPPLPLQVEGAVIFGHNINFSRDCDQSDDLREYESYSVPGEGKSPFQDSGIGQSLVSLVSSDTAETRRDQDSISLPNRSHSTVGRLEYSLPIRTPVMEPLTCESYAVGIVCALEKELLAVRALFDGKHSDLTMPPGDTNHYALGRVARHNVVAACLPSGEYGTNSAASVVAHMARSFPSLKFCLLVGIGGGVPSAHNDIRLGDVVVSWPTDTYPGVVQYDLGKTLAGGQFTIAGLLNRPSRFLMTAMSSLRSDPDISMETRLLDHVQTIENRRPDYKSPGLELDKLYTSDCVPNNTSGICNCLEVSRATRRGSHPQIHYGLIASGNQVIKDSFTRDRLGHQHNVLCVEMEAAGIMNTVDCLVIRGICDYADSHKNDIWQEYAAATAAAYMKMFLSVARSADEGYEISSGAAAGSKRPMRSSSPGGSSPWKRARR